MYNATCEESETGTGAQCHRGQACPLDDHHLRSYYHTMIIRDYLYLYCSEHLLPHPLSLVMLMSLVMPTLFLCDADF